MAGKNVKVWTLAVFMMAMTMVPTGHSMASGDVHSDGYLGELYMWVLDTEKLVGYTASFPYIRSGKIQKQAVSHVFDVDNDVNSSRFLLSSQSDVIVFNISARIFPKVDGVIDPKIYFQGSQAEKTSPDGNEITIKGNLGVKGFNKTVDIVATCDPNKQLNQNTTMRIRMTFTFQVISGSKSNPPVQVVVNRRKKCFLSAGKNEEFLSGKNASQISDLPLGWNPLEPSSSSSIFFVSVGISLGVIFIICGVVVFYHFTTFKPQQRKNQFYSELPFSDPNNAYTAHGHVPMFMPKGGLSPAGPAVVGGPVSYTASTGLNTTGSVHLFPGGSNMSAVDSPSPFLNQSKISDASAMSNSRIVDPAFNFVHASYNAPQGQVCCYAAATQLHPQHSRSAGSPAATPTDLQKTELSGNSADSGLDMTGQPGGVFALKFSDIEVAKELVTIHEILQEGTFGRLCRGFVTIPRGPDSSPDTPAEREVYMKTVAANSSTAQIDMMLREGGKFRRVNNKYVLSLAGVVTPNYVSNNSVISPPMLLYPYSENGNLKLFLKQLRENHQPLTTKEVLGMAVHIGKAVQYLQEKKKMVVADLATRNCVVDGRLGVKITDSALARDVFPSDYHCLGDELNRPVKWLSPEALLTYSSEAPGDVWSFGVVVWELLTFAQQPYLDTDPFEMLNFLRSGERLLQPLNCPDELYHLMESCWTWDSEERPKIHKVVSYLTDFNKTLGAYI